MEPGNHSNGRKKSDEQIPHDGSADARELLRTCASKEKKQFAVDRKVNNRGSDLLESPLRGMCKFNSTAVNSGGDNVGQKKRTGERRDGRHAVLPGREKFVEKTGRS